MTMTRKRLGDCLRLQPLLLLLMITTVTSETYYCDDKPTRIQGVDYNVWIITRRDWTNFYRNNLWCEWQIDAGPTRKIRITFSKINLEPIEPNKGCDGNDVLTIRDGISDKTSPVLVKICSSANPSEVISSTRYLHLTFESNKNNFFDNTGIEMKIETFDVSDCPPGWVNGPPTSPTSQRCFHLHTVPPGGANFSQAQTYCGYSHGNLATINSDILYEFVLVSGNLEKYRPLFHLWIGLNDLEVEGTFTWLNGGHFYYTERMSSITENDATKNCVVLSFRSKTLISVPCSDRYFYLCERYIYDGHSSVYTIPTRRDIFSGDVETSNKVKETAIGVTCMIIFFGLFGCIPCYVIKANKRKAKRTARTRMQESDHQTAGQCADQTEHNQEADREASQALVPPVLDRRSYIQPTAPPEGELRPVVADINYTMDPGPPPSYWEAMNMIQPPVPGRTPASFHQQSSVPHL